MEIFKKDGKVNFVDKNNVVVGYDMDHDCCEVFGYIFMYCKPTSDKIDIENIISDPEDIGLCDNDVVFDVNFFERIDQDESQIAIFRFVIEEEKYKGYEAFLVLWNCHRGYYSHGFEIKKGEEMIREGNL